LEGRKTTEMSDRICCLIEHPNQKSAIVIEYDGLPMDKKEFGKNDLNDPDKEIQIQKLPKVQPIVALHLDIEGKRHQLNPHNTENTRSEYSITKLELANFIVGDIRSLKREQKRRESNTSTGANSLDGLLLQRVRYVDPKHLDVEFTYKI
jgi:hypothetical protein